MAGNIEGTTVIPFSQLRSLKLSPPARLPEHPVSTFSSGCLKGAELFYNALKDDLFPQEEAEKIWGFEGDPSSAENQRLYRAYQLAQKYGTLSAQQLYEAMYSYPRVGESLTRLLQETKIIRTEQDHPVMIQRLVKEYKELVDGLVVHSEVDQWRCCEELGTAQAAALCANKFTSSVK